MNLKILSDKILYKLCKKWGAEALHARRKFAGLLPEVNKRRLYEKKGYGSVYEFAAKLAGMSRDQVDIVLRLEKRFEDKPLLHAALTDGKISANKLARVVSIATAENEKLIAEKIEPLSQKAVEVFVQDYRNNIAKNIDGDEKQNLNGSQKPSIEAKSLRAQTLMFEGEPVHGQIDGQEMKPSSSQTLKLETDVERELIEMQERGIDVNDFLRQALQQRRNEITQMKKKIAEEERKKHDERAVIGFPASRHIPAKTIRIVHSEWGNKCASPGCERKAAQIHHERQFALYQSHDPNLLKPLCKGHHELMHAG